MNERYKDIQKALRDSIYELKRKFENDIQKIDATTSLFDKTEIRQILESEETSELKSKESGV